MPPMTEVPAPDAAPPEPAVPAPRRRRVHPGVLAAAVVAIGLLGWWGFTSSYETPEHQAIRACETWVRGQLVAPATAKFSAEQFFDTDHPEVAGFVDSQNPAGALLRSSFSCVMAQQGGRWVAVDGDVT